MKIYSLTFRTIFDKISLPYDTLRSMENPIRPIVDHYKSQLKEGDELWWIDTGDNQEVKSTNISVRLWNNLTIEERDKLIISAFTYFPELLGKSGKKYSRFTVWLVTKHGIVSPSLRDTFTAGGKRQSMLYF